MDIGGKVREARDALGLTQHQLAEAVELSRDAILSIEGGTRKVKADELWRIARELERPFAYFLQSGGQQDLAVVAWRGGQTVTPDVRRAELWLRRHFDDYQSLARILEVDVAPEVSAEVDLRTGLVVDQARLAAQAERSRHKLDDQPVPDVAEHLEHCVRVPVFGRNIDDADFCGMLVISPDMDAAAMLVNGRLLASRRNFTMAHEYGHLVWKLKRSEPTADVFYRCPEETEEEMFANAFAAQFLAPDDSIREGAAQINVSSDHPDGIMRLAAGFGVSFQMMTYRLQNLGILGKQEAAAVRDRTAPTLLPSFRSERLAFHEMSPRYWDFVLKAYLWGELDASRCAEMVDHGAAEFAEIVAELVEELSAELIDEDSLLQAAS